MSFLFPTYFLYCKFINSRVSLGITVPTAQGYEPCNSTAVKIWVANGHTPQPPRGWSLIWASWWHWQPCHTQMKQHLLNTDSSEGIAIIGLQGFAMQYYFFAKYSCLVLICPRKLTYYLNTVFFFACQAGSMCVCECMFVCI